MLIKQLNPLTLALLLAAGSWAENPKLPFVPLSFTSTAKAESFAKELFAGGSVQVLKIEGTEILVLEVLGSGLPTIALVIYLPEEHGWVHRETWRPDAAERFDVNVVDDRLFAVGQTTGEKWEIFSSSSDTQQSSRP